LSTQIDASINVQSPTSISGTKKNTTRKNIDSPSSFQQQLLKVLDKSQNINDESDDDKHFLLSLLPGMKAIDNDNKMDARIELMQVVQKYSKKRPAESAISSYCLQPIQYPSSIPALNTNDYGLQVPENSSSSSWQPRYY